MDKSKKLYEPFKYTGKGNARYSVYVKGPNGNPKLIHFSDKRYENFHQHKDKKRQKSYLARAKGIKNAAGQLTWKLKDSKNYWSVRLWLDNKPSWA